MMSPWRHHLLSNPGVPILNLRLLEGISVAGALPDPIFGAPELGELQRHFFDGKTLLHHQRMPGFTQFGCTIT